MKKILNLTLIICLLLSIFSTNVFAEQKEDYSILKTLEIMVGDGKGNMRLDDKVTRAEFTKVAATISNFRKSIPLSQKTSPFADVPYKHWASSYIKAAVDNGIVTGYPDSTFKPDNYVKYEEALTILLKILGYTNNDFGEAYPYGQYSLANNIDLTEDVDAKLFEDLTRRQVADLLINALETNFKNSSLTPYSNFDAAKMSDVIILATTKEDASVPHDKVLTTNGLFKYNVDLSSYVGQKGTLVIKDGDTVIYFNSETNSANSDKFAIYSVVSDGVIVYKNKAFTQINISDNTTTYYNNSPSTFAAVKNGLTMGDTILINRTPTNEIDYINIFKGDLEGPYIYRTESDFYNKVPTINDCLIIKNGNTIDKNELEKNDVFYYSKDLDIVMVYNTKITGVYNSATPNQESPITVEISGKMYEIESAEAFQLLSSTGLYKYGDTVTILLGKNKKIAGVVNPDTVDNKNIGYVIDAGIKNYTTDENKTVSQYYVSIVTPDGENTEYKAKRDMSSYKNSVVEVKFDGELVTLTKVNSKNVNINGKFNYESLMIDNIPVSKNVKILDIGTLDSEDSPLYKCINPQRIDGVKLTSSNVIYYEINEKNILTKLILKDVTGDYYQYGVVTKVTKVDNEMMLSGTYKFNVNGSEQTFATQNQIFGVDNGPAKIVITPTGITSMQNLTRAKGTVKDINHNYVTVNATHYLLDENVKIYYRNFEYDYMLVSMEEILADKEYDIQGAYYDKSPSAGGRIRVIIVTK